MITGIINLKFGERCGQEVHRCESELEKLEEDFVGFLGMFIKGKLRVIEENSDFIEEEVYINNINILKDDIIKAIKTKKL